MEFFKEIKDKFKEEVDIYRSRGLIIPLVAVFFLIGLLTISLIANYQQRSIFSRAQSATPTPPPIRTPTPLPRTPTPIRTRTPTPPASSCLVVGSCCSNSKRCISINNGLYCIGQNCLIPSKTPTPIRSKTPTPRTSVTQPPPPPTIGDTCGNFSYPACGAGTCSGGKECKANDTTQSCNCVSAANPAPKGSHDGFSGPQPLVNCRAGGWAYDASCDVDDKVQVSIDGTVAITGVAGLYRSDLEGVCPGGTCAFDINLYNHPLMTKGVNHSIKVEARAVANHCGFGNWWQTLSNTPKTLKCQ